MSFYSAHSLIIAALAACISSVAAAQDAVDWDLLVKPEEDLTVAYTQFDNGLLVGARCQERTFQVLIGGLPEAPEAKDLMSARRTLQISIGDGPLAAHGFHVGDNRRTAFAELPAPLARQMRTGGRMQIVVSGVAEGGRNLRYVVDLPQSNAAIDQALTACGRPLSDPRDLELAALADDGLPTSFNWQRQPTFQYPAGGTYTAGFAVMSCLSQTDGRLASCLVETEFPADGGFGAAVLRGAPTARLQSKDGGPLPVRQIVFRTNFQMEDGVPRGPRLGRLGRDE